MKRRDDVPIKFRVKSFVKGRFAKRGGLTLDTIPSDVIEQDYREGWLIESDPKG